MVDLVNCCPGHLSGHSCFRWHCLFDYKASKEKRQICGWRGQTLQTRQRQFCILQYESTNPMRFFGKKQEQTCINLFHNREQADLPKNPKQILEEIGLLSSTIVLWSQEIPRNPEKSQKIQNIPKYPKNPKKSSLWTAHTYCSRSKTVQHSTHIELFLQWVFESHNWSNLAKNCPEQHNQYGGSSQNNPCHNACNWT